MNETPPVRHAASLLLVRPGAVDTEVLMGARSAGHRFMPNRLVFPGGVVDTEDYAAPVAREAEARVLQRLAADDAALARALTHAASRELEEETGLHLGVPPDLSGLDYLCRAITPETMKFRFDARFLVVDAALVDGTLAGSGELEGLSWFGVDAALALDLAFPTRKVLERLQLWLALDEAARQTDTSTPTLRDREWVAG
jgi:8-oxo-dGTP pyrophosphatase MutT (NUDIX family)